MRTGVFVIRGVFPDSERVVAGGGGDSEYYTFIKQLRRSLSSEDGDGKYSGGYRCY